MCLEPSDFFQTLMEIPLIPSTLLHCLPYNHNLHPESCMERELHVCAHKCFLIAMKHD